MSEMIERVALAMRKREWGSDEPDPHWHGEVRDLWMGFARAAIEAMREPTDGMKKKADYSAAMAHMEVRGSGAGWLYSVMIDAALSEDTA